jgi:hypothetical protein
MFKLVGRVPLVVRYAVSRAIRYIHLVFKKWVSNPCQVDTTLHARQPWQSSDQSVLDTSMMLSEIECHP